MSKEQIRKVIVLCNQDPLFEGRRIIYEDAVK